MKTRILIALCAGLLPVAAASAAPLLNEFEPNPAGGDPADTTVELLGDAGTAFDLWIVSIENDGYNGTVDRASNVSGSFDANGLAVVTVPDLENPSFTVVLSDDFEGSIGDDLDALDDGNLDVSTLGTIYDALGVSDNAGDDATLYGATLGGTDVLYNGQFEPLNVFRDSESLLWYQSVTADFGDPTERIAIFPADASVEIAPAAFTPDASAPTFGSANPTIPEPGTVALALLSLASVGAASMRSRLG